MTRRPATRRVSPGRRASRDPSRLTSAQRVRTPAPGPSTVRCVRAAERNRRTPCAVALSSQPHTQLPRTACHRGAVCAWCTRCETHAQKEVCMWCLSFGTKTAGKRSTPPCFVHRAGREAATPQMPPSRRGEASGSETWTDPCLKRSAS
eukprot:56537-Prymnesium_polylepis.1